MKPRPVNAALEQWLPAALAALLAAGNAWATPNPHDIRTQRDDEVRLVCQRCHEAVASLGNGAAVASDATARAQVCLSCHTHDAATHPVAARPQHAVPEDLPLSADGTVGCLTCHHAHGPLTDDEPWASVSLLDRLFDRERLRRTFLLRRRNTNGELCRACHSPKTESK